MNERDRRGEVSFPRLSSVAAALDGGDATERGIADNIRRALGDAFPDQGWVERVALRMFRVHVYGTLTSERYDASARNQWVKVLDEDDRETWRQIARALLSDLNVQPQWGVRVDGGGVRLFDSEIEARAWMDWTAARAAESTFEPVWRAATPWVNLST